jgi:hypothetical protein
MGAYPPALSEIVLRALAPEPDDRFQTMQAFQIALESFARESGLALSTVTLASFVQELFAEELAAWRAAQREGKTLGEHLAAKPAVVASADPVERTATDAFGTTRRREQRRVRRMRFAVLAGLVVFGLAGAVVAKLWLGGAGPAPIQGSAALVEKNPRSGAPGAERNPATSPTAEKLAPPTSIPVAAGSSTATPLAAKPDKEKTKVKPAVIRQGRAATASGQTPGPRPTADSRLGSWDPDSPVPP